MEQKNVLRNITGTACICFAISAMNVNGTMIVNGYNSAANAIYTDFEESQNDSKKTDLTSDINEVKTSRIEAEASALFGKMRDATVDEQASVNKYIKSISKDTGVNFYDIC